MAWTQSDMDKLKAAMAKGVKKVRYTDGEVEYQSVADMERVLGLMDRELNPHKFTSRRVGRFVTGF